MGRQKESASEKKAKGNPGKRKIVDDPEIQPILDSAPPEGMDENQIRYWNRYAPYMIKNKFLTDLNITDLISLCNYEVQREKVRQYLLDACASLLQEKKNYHGVWLRWEQRRRQKADDGRNCNILQRLDYCNFG